MPQSYDAIIIGGGAAGLMCAQIAGHRGRRILLIEHANKVGKKILMSGGGRCNFTNLDVRPEHFLSANPHFCKSAIARYRPEDFIALVDKHGIAWHEKELGQLFCDESSKLIVRMLLAECEAAGARIEIDCAVEKVEANANTFLVTTARGVAVAPRLVVATGGLSIPSMGATGFGYDLARQFGHHVLPTRAALVPLTLSGRPLETYGPLSGLALDVKTSCGKAAFSNRMLFTHRGLSGPAILQISSYWQPGADLRIDLFPNLDAEEWLLARQQERADAMLHTVLAEYLPRRLAETLCEAHFGRRPMRHHQRKELYKVARMLHDWPVAPSGSEGYRTAEVTLGGVDTNELSSSTMASKFVPGLHFIGEVVDVTGWLGGYNFQWAWASAAAAAHAL